MRTLFLVASLVITPCAFAAHDTRVFFDYKTCKSHVISNEPNHGDPNFDRWETKAAAARQHQSFLTVYSANNSLGLCLDTYTDKTRRFSFSCEKESYNNFPLAGASYHGITDKNGALLRYECESSCPPTAPRIVYDQGYESDESDPNAIELEKAYEKFYEACPPKGRKP